MVFEEVFQQQPVDVRLSWNLFYGGGGSPAAVDSAVKNRLRK